MSQEFANIFASLRHKKGLNQRQAAADLNISQALLSHYENGLREPRLEFVIKACEYYGVTADYMFGRTENCTEETSAILETIRDTVNQIGERYGKEAAEKVASYLNLALYKIAVCTDMAEDRKCDAAMSLIEAEMASQYGNHERNAKWFKTNHKEQYDKITEKIKSIKAR